MVLLIALIFIGLAIILFIRQQQDVEKGQENQRKKRQPVHPSSNSSERQEIAINDHSVYLRERIIYLAEPITHKTANRVVSQLLFLEADDPNSDIFLYINSSGGSVYDGLGIYDTMQHVKPDINTVCTEIAEGMGAFLLCAGAKGKRSSLLNTRIVLGQLVAGDNEEASDKKIQEDEILLLRSHLNKELSKRTGQTIERINSLQNVAMTPAEAVSYGVIDNTINKQSTFSYKSFS